MSIEAVRAFMGKVKADPDLQEKLEAIEGDKDATLAEVVHIASEAGFSFTVEDYDAAVLDMAQARHAAGDLSDEELDAVAGGQHKQLGNESDWIMCPPDESDDPHTKILTPCSSEPIIIAE